MDMTLTNSLFRTDSMPNWKRTTTRGPSLFSKCSSLNCCKSSSVNDWGVEILTGYPKKSDSAVDAAPIIWFINSQMALTDNSLSSNSSSEDSMPIIISTMTFASSRFSSIMLLPSKPETYLISIPIAGSRSPMLNSSTGTTLTVGVVISTR